MSDTKQNKYSSLLANANNLPRPRSAVKYSDAPVGKATKQTGGEVRSWDAYRNWLTKVQVPEQRRSVPDPALFSFKGYRSWAEKIRRDWETDD